MKFVSSGTDNGNVRRRRNCAAPHQHFMTRLIKFSRKHSMSGGLKRNTAMYSSVDSCLFDAFQSHQKKCEIIISSAESDRYIKFYYLSANKPFFGCNKMFIFDPSSAISLEAKYCGAPHRRAKYFFKPIK